MQLSLISTTSATNISQVYFIFFPNAWISVHELWDVAYDE